MSNERERTEGRLLQDTLLGCQQASPGASVMQGCTVTRWNKPLAQLSFNRPPLLPACLQLSA